MEKKKTLKELEEMPEMLRDFHDTKAVIEAEKKKKKPAEKKK